ncbi:MAG TPA: bifunctional ADP-dependent NAD(P)H-hydrate dehydratase/NAD(P)H-hydrate epimerase [Clostridiales bacterium]|nr:bifunctional ADP-dependent NAD(P)H-hydrate dehydratase/NAD(P)H-hydrate epimerase [Clostridiales bacterium]
MVRLFTAAEMREADRLAVEAGVPSLILMENAGRAVARLATRLLEEVPPGRRGSLLVLAGKGNNGGDGLVAARLLAGLGLPVEVVLAGSEDSFTGDALTNLRALEAQGLVRPRVFGRELEGPAFSALVKEAAVVVDALLGTGVSGAPREPVATLISLLGAVPEACVLAVDLPSGLDADTGRAPGQAVRARATVTFGGVKLGLALPGAAAFTGRLYLADIGLPPSCLERAGRARWWLLPREAAAWLPARPADGHKGTFGHVWVAAGSPGFTGAAVLTALGALRAGAGLATAAVPEGSRALVAGSFPEALTKGLEEGPDGRVAAGAAAGLLADLGGAAGEREGRVRASLVVGPGLGVSDEVARFVTALVRESPVPAVLDADALNCLALQGPEAAAAVLPSGAGRTVVTPHPGEMARLTGLSVTDIQGDRLTVASDAARLWKVVVVLKGAGTVVASPDGEVWMNATGNPAMATAGSGDVLAGALGAFLAQGLPLDRAACLAVCAHGLAGDLAARDIGGRGLLARDIAHGLPVALDVLSSAEGYGPVELPLIGFPGGGRLRNGDAGRGPDPAGQARPERDRKREGGPEREGEVLR